MKKKSTSQSAFFNLRLLIGLFIVLAGVFLALMGFGAFSAQAQQKARIITNSTNPLLPNRFDCSQIRALGIDRQDNLRAGAIRIACGEAEGGSASNFSELMQQLLAATPLAYGGTDVNLIGAETGRHVTQSETFAWRNSDNPNEIVVAYNDSRSSTSSNISGVSVSTDGGITFTRLTKSDGQSPFSNTFGDPVVLYNSPSGTWFAIFLDEACGGQGIGGYKSTNPSDPNSWTHFGCVHSGVADDRESGWADNNPSSPFFGYMYVSRNDFNVGGGALFVSVSTDNGSTWTQHELTTSFIRDVQLTGDAGGSGDVYLAAMDEMGGSFANRANKIFRSTDGGTIWTNTFTGGAFPAPGITTCPNPYFACMFNTSQGGYWRHMGWGEPAALNGVVHYVYASGNTSNGDAGNIFYIRSTDKGVTFSAPLQLNTDTTTRPQWQPNISVSPGGTLFAMWYDARESTSCQKGNTGVPCYRMWGRKSTDNGVSWLADMAFSDVVSPLPGQPDPGIIAEYAGDYDYGSALVADHITAWDDGRVPINGQSQQDTFFDKEPAGAAASITLSAQARTRQGSTKVKLTWSPADGGQVNVLRNSVVIRTTADDGLFYDNLGTQTGTFTYQVCETDSGDCSNEVDVVVP
jgi:hypothetical protein